MAKIWQVRSDIEARVFNGLKPDDSPITRRLVRYHMNLARADIFNKLRRSFPMAQIEADWVSQVDCLPGTLAVPDCTCGPAAKYYIDLPQTVMGMPEDRGIRSVLACADGEAALPFKPALPGQMAIYSRLRFGKPSPTNPYFYRLGSRLFLLAGERRLDRCTFSVLAVLDAPVDMDCDDETERTAEFPMPATLLEELAKQATASLLAERQVPADTANDGKDKGTTKVI